MAVVFLCTDMHTPQEEQKQISVSEITHWNSCGHLVLLNPFVIFSDFNALCIEELND